MSAPTWEQNHNLCRVLADRKGLRVTISESIKKGQKDKKGENVISDISKKVKKKST